MIIPNKKKAASIIVERMHPNEGYAKGGEVEKSDEEVHQEAMKSIAADILQAIHSKSAEMLKSSLMSFLEQHDMHEASESPEEEAAEHRME